ncbi:hypothetical protein Scep_027965 [Stephania cephalantha]|uniref:Uncharacterized protein n=1 Tax=Stephania cephalantha TaxID=152367 RepID=A0AAP0EGE2_9MAGN
MNIKPKLEMLQKALNERLGLKLHYLYQSNMNHNFATLITSWLRLCGNMTDEAMKKFDVVVE